MKKRICLFVLNLFTLTLFAQAYKTAGGVRLGTNYGISLQQKINDNLTVEGVAHYDFRSKADFSLVGKQYKKLLIKNLTYFYGAGLHKGWIKDYYINDEGNKIDLEGQETKDPIGITGTAGVELTLGRINVSMDYRPKVNISGGPGLLDHNTALTVRYVLIEDNKKSPFNGIKGGNKSKGKAKSKSSKGKSSKPTMGRNGKGG